jgi:hypothetical protein
VLRLGIEETPVVRCLWVVIRHRTPDLTMPRDPCANCHPRIVSLLLEVSGA